MNVFELVSNQFRHDLPLAIAQVNALRVRAIAAVEHLEKTLRVLQEEATMPTRSTQSDLSAPIPFLPLPDENPFEDFLKEATRAGKRAAVTVAELRTRYQTWCARNAVEPLNQLAFARALRAKGYRPDRAWITPTHLARIWRGLALKPIRKATPKLAKAAPKRRKRKRT